MSWADPWCGWHKVFVAVNYITNGLRTAQRRTTKIAVFLDVTPCDLPPSSLPRQLYWKLCQCIIAHFLRDLNISGWFLWKFEALRLHRVVSVCLYLSLFASLLLVVLFFLIHLSFCLSDLGIDPSAVWSCLQHTQHSPTYCTAYSIHPRTYQPTTYTAFTHVLYCLHARETGNLYIFFLSDMRLLILPYPRESVDHYNASELNSPKAG